MAWLLPAGLTGAGDLNPPCSRVPRELPGGDPSAKSTRRICRFAGSRRQHGVLTGATATAEPRRMCSTPRFHDRYAEPDQVGDRPNHVQITSPNARATSPTAGRVPTQPPMHHLPSHPIAPGHISDRRPGVEDLEHRR